MGCGSSSSTDSSQPSSKPGLLFSWPKAGNILLKTVKFRAEYDPRSKELVIRLSDKTVTESRLIWNGDKFELEDIRKVDTISGKAEPVTGLKLQFIVSPEGRFRDMLSTQKLLEQLAIAQKVNLSLNQIHKATNKLVKEVKNQWGRWVEAWLSPHTSNGPVQSCGRPCLKLLSSTDHREDIPTFLAAKYGPNVSHVIMAETSDSVSAVVEKQTLRPHIVKMRSYRYLCLDVGGRKVRDIWEETAMTVFVWPDIPQLGTDAFLKSETAKMAIGVSQLVESMHQRLQFLHQSE